MPLDSAKYSCYSTASLDRRNLSSSSRWRTSSSPMSGSSSLYISNYGFSGLDTSSTYEPSPASLSMYLPPRSPTPASNSSRAVRSSSLSSSKDYRTSQFSPAVNRRKPQSEFANRGYFSQDTASLQPASSYYSTSTASRSPYTRSLTTDLSTNVSASRFTSSYPSRTTYSSYSSTYRYDFRPIVIERPSLDEYVPRPKEERDKLPGRAIRRDRPLIKLIERRDLNPAKVRNLLNAWAKDEILEEESADEERDSRKRDSVRSDDSGIGSFRGSRRSRQKSGELSGELCQECSRNEHAVKDARRSITKGVTSPVVDEGVHLDAEEAGRRSVESASSPCSPENSTDGNFTPILESITNDVTENQHDSSVEQDLSQSKRRVRINADKYVISFDKTRKSCDENNNLDVQNLNSTQKVVGKEVLDSGHETSNYSSEKSGFLQSPPPVQESKQPTVSAVPTLTSSDISKDANNKSGKIGKTLQSPKSPTSPIKPFLTKGQVNSSAEVLPANQILLLDKKENALKSEAEVTAPKKREIPQKQEIEKPVWVGKEIGSTVVPLDKRGEKEKSEKAACSEDKFAPKLIKPKVPKGQVSPNHFPTDEAQKSTIKQDKGNEESSKNVSVSTPVAPTPTVVEKVSLNGQPLQPAPDATQKPGLKPESKPLWRTKKDVPTPGIKANEKKLNHELNAVAKPLWMKSKEGTQNKGDTKGEAIMQKKIVKEKTEPCPDSKLVKTDTALAQADLERDRKKEMKDAQSDNLIKGGDQLKDVKETDIGADVEGSKLQSVKLAESSLENGRKDVLIQSSIMSQKPSNDKRKSAPDIRCQYGQKLQKSSSADAVQTAKGKVNRDIFSNAAQKSLDKPDVTSTHLSVSVDEKNKDIKSACEKETTKVLEAETGGKNVNKVRRSTTTDFPAFKAEPGSHKLQKSFTTDCSAKKRPANGIKFEKPPIPLPQIKKFEKILKIDVEKHDTKLVAGKESKAKTTDESIPCKAQKIVEVEKPLETSETDPAKAKASDVSANTDKKYTVQDTVSKQTRHGAESLSTTVKQLEQKSSLPNDIKIDERSEIQINQREQEKTELNDSMKDTTLGSPKTDAELKDIPTSALEPKVITQTSSLLKIKEIKETAKEAQNQNALDKTTKKGVKTKDIELNAEGILKMQTEETKVKEPVVSKSLEVPSEPRATKITPTETPSSNNTKQHPELIKKDKATLLNKGLISNDSNVSKAEDNKEKLKRISPEKPKKTEIKKEIETFSKKANIKISTDSNKTDLSDTSQPPKEKIPSVKSVPDAVPELKNKDLDAKQCSSGAIKIPEEKVGNEKLAEKQVLSEEKSKVSCDSTAQEINYKSESNSTVITELHAVSTNETKLVKVDFSVDRRKSIKIANNLLKNELENKHLDSSPMKKELGEKQADETPLDITKVTKVPDLKATDTALKKEKKVVSNFAPVVENKLQAVEILTEKAKSEVKDKTPTDSTDVKIVHDSNLEKKTTPDSVTPRTHADPEQEIEKARKAATQDDLPKAEKIAKKKKVKTEGEEGKVKDKVKKVKKKKVPRTSLELKEISSENIQAKTEGIPDGLHKKDAVGAVKGGDLQNVPDAGKGEKQEGAKKSKLPPATCLEDVWFDYCDVKSQSPPPVYYSAFERKLSITDFNLLKVLGRGSYGKVMLAEMKGFCQPVAIKCLKKNVVQNDQDVESTMIEREVLALGRKHPFLCRMLCTFQNESHLFFVMEYLSGGDMMFHLNQAGRFDQGRARFYATEIVCALQYLHKYGIIYRDAKLDNICLDEEGHIRLVDFGFCKLRIKRKERLPRNICGTPDYMAPEIIRGFHYNQSVDWWAFGVLLFEMLTGQSPFRGSDESELFWIICNDEVSYPAFISREARQIMTYLFERDPEKRLGMPGCIAGDIRYMPFFYPIDWEKAENKQLIPPFKPQVVSRTDVSNFDADFINETPVLTPTREEILKEIDQAQFRRFSYMNQDAFFL